MATVPTVAQKAQAFKDFLDSEKVKNRLQEVVGDKANQFALSILQLYNSNSKFNSVNHTSIMNAVLTATALDLPINHNLGFSYVVPYGDKAQFQIGYKGFIQLAQRSGQFKRIVSVEVYANQLVEENPIEGYVFDWKQKPVADEIPCGFLAYFKLLNGFEAELYMSYEEVMNHARKYSKAINSKSSPWQTNFNAMAKKTVLKLLLSRQAPLSIEMQTSILADQSVVQDDNSFNYVDNPKTTESAVEVVSDEQFLMLENNIENGTHTSKEVQESGYSFTAQQKEKLAVLAGGQNE